MLILFIFLSHLSLHADPMIESLAGCLESRDEDLSVEADIKDKIKNYAQGTLLDRIQIYVDNAQLQKSISACVEDTLIARFGAHTSFAEFKNDEQMRAQMDRLALYAGLLQGEEVRSMAPEDYLQALKTRSLRDELNFIEQILDDESVAPGVTFGRKFVERQNDLSVALARARASLAQESTPLK